eukprot:scaffold340_cov256-Pinguiococcus_pyrenoidosus.AAC.22
MHGLLDKPLTAPAYWRKATRASNSQNREGASREHSLLGKSIDWPKERPPSIGPVASGATVET